MAIKPPKASQPVSRGRGRPALHRTAPLERDDILDCALRIVQKEGREAVSMRRLARELGVTPMALYHHVPDKPALMSALVDRVWATITEQTPTVSDPIEFTVQSCLNIRRVWLTYFDLASLAVAVAEPDDAFFALTKSIAEGFEVLGFPDVPLAYNAIQNFTLGSVEIAANRKASSLYFGRDPKAVRSRALRLLSKQDASSNHRGVVDARFDEGDERYFEGSLRALIAGLRAGA